MSVQKVIAIALVLLSVAVVCTVLLTINLHNRIPTTSVVEVDTNSVPRSKVGPKVSTKFRSQLWKRTLEQVAKDFGIDGRLECIVVERERKSH